MTPSAALRRDRAYALTVVFTLALTISRGIPGEDGFEVVVAAVGALACFVAARQGLVIDPATALREE